jgi:hypothetical protein
LGVGFCWDLGCPCCFSIEYDQIHVVSRDEADQLNTNRAQVNNFVACPGVAYVVSTLATPAAGVAAGSACEFATNQYTPYVHEGDVIRTHIKMCDDRPYETNWSNYSSSFIEYR